MGEYQLSRRQSREATIIFLYQYLIEEEYYKSQAKFFNVARFIKEHMDSLNVSLQEMFNTNKEIKLINDDYFISIVEQINDIDKSKNELEKKLDKSWKFERIGKMEQAIMINALIELLLNNTEKRIIINEAVELAKKYCDVDSYKFINGVLDKF